MECQVTTNEGQNAFAINRCALHKFDITEG